MIGDHLFEDIPNFVVFALKHLLGRLDRVGMPKFLEAANDERLIQFEGDLLGQAALMQLEPRTHDDHASVPSSQHACRASSRGTGPAYP